VRKRHTGWYVGALAGLVAGLALPSSVMLAKSTGPATPVAAANLLVKLDQAGVTGPSACSDEAGWSIVKGCPITARLQHRLLQHPTEGPDGGADPICRCQNIAPTRVTLLNVKGSVAHVNVRWAFQLPETITFVVVLQHKVWLVDDQFCSGYPNTSIYKSPVGPC